MDTTQIQTLLAKFGFDPGPIDGVDGPKTQAAISEFLAFSGGTDLSGSLTEWDTAGRTKDNPSGTGQQATNAVADDTNMVDANLPKQQATPVPGVESVGPTAAQSTIPTGMRLVVVNNPAGSDATQLFYLMSKLYGVDVAYEVGDIERLKELFGGIGSFSDVSTVNQSTFDNQDIIVRGSVDEILGSTDSLQAQAERDMREGGLESPPPWMLNDPKAMFTFLTATNEGYSSERTWGMLAPLDSFKKRYAGLDTVSEQIGATSYGESISEYLRREAEIRNALIANRGPSTDTSQEYVSSLIGSGWQPAEVGQLLGLEKRVKENPEALANINDILTFQGLDPLSPDDFVSFLQDSDASTIDPGYTPSNMFEAVNDALRVNALLTEGINIDVGFASDLGTGTSDAIQTEETYSKQAQLAAGFIARNSRELDLGKMGLTREDIIAATFGEARDGGKTVSETNAILEKFVKERAKAARGFAGSQSFIDASGRLRMQGFSGFQ